MKTKRFLKKILLGFCMSVALSLTTYAQESEGGTPLSFSQSNSSRARLSIPVYTTSAIPLQTLQAEDAIFDQGSYPYRFGYGFDVSLDVKKVGVMQELPDGTHLWTLQVSCPGALSINFLYSQFKLPAGAKFFIYNKDKSMIIGAYTKNNNTSTGKFATEIVAGDLVTLEYSEPSSPEFSGELVVGKIVHGYRGHSLLQPSVQAAGSCNVNVNCPQAASWQTEKRSVARILMDGTGLCTGTLVNNTSQNDKPYFLTANHCLGGKDAINNPDASGYIFYWNYESSTCSGTTGPTNQTTSGAVIRANNAASDFALLELNAKPAATLNVYYAGWNRGAAAANGVVGIHHPAGDVKKFSQDNSTVENSDGGTHWRVPSWDIGVTEGGSSGSAIFDFNKRVVGQLHGGASGCGSSEQWDVYGKIFYSWDQGGTVAQRRLKDWLDPANTGALTVDGKNPGGTGNNSPVATITAPANNATYTAPASITITANASDSDGSVVKVEFFNGTTPLGSDNTAPYSFVWNNVAAGLYNIRAVATDDKGATGTSAIVSVRVNVANAVATFYQHCNFDLSGYAVGLAAGNYTQAQLASFGIADNDVSSLKVQSGYEIVLYELDNFQGASQTFNGDVSCLVANSINDWASSIRVRAIVVNQPPVVSITAPLNNATFTAPANISITANATDDVSVSNVEFFNGSTPLGSDNTAPYSFAWNGVAAGTYQLTARATDGGNLTTTSSVITITVNPAPVLRDPENPAVTVNGLEYSYYEGSWSALPAFASLTPVKTGNVANYDISVRNRNDQFGFQFKGFVNVPADGQYTFYTSSDDGSRLFIGSTMVVDNDGLHGVVERSGTIGLKAGKHAVTVTFFEQGGGEVLAVSYAGPGITKQAIPAAALFRIPQANVAPTVSITSPANNATFTSPANITITANATDSDGSVTNVQFFNGSTPLGSDNTAPYSFAWNGVAAGTYTLTAVATDNSNASTTSSVVTIQVNVAPVFIATVYKHCDYSTAGYAVGLDIGNYTMAQLVAKGIVDNDISSVKIQPGYEIVLYTNDNFSGTSLVIRANNPCLVTNSFNDVTSSVRVRAIPVNQSPSVNITSPANNASFTAPASITISASATDDGTITKVEFYNGAIKLGEDAIAPYSYAWSNIAGGSYSITAKATDNIGASTTSAVVTITVVSTTDNCTNVAQYTENGGYVAGSKVKNEGKLYECKPWPSSGWCNGASWAYAPGTGAYWSDAWIDAGACTASASTSINKQLLVSPNPTNAIITVDFSNLEQTKVNVLVIDSYGREVTSQEITSGGQIDLSALPTGVYTLKTIADGEVITNRVIKR